MTTFGRLGWYYLLSPECYTQDFFRDDVLQAPAYTLQEWDNGWIEVQCFDDPTQSQRPDNQQRLITLNQYLYDAYHQHFVQQYITRR